MAQRPFAPTHQHRIKIHGDRRVDSYAWIRDIKNPHTLRYLKSENRFTAAAMKPYQKLQKQIYIELKTRILEVDSTAPSKWGRFFYYSRTEKGKAYRIHCRRKNVPDAPEEILFDGNKLSRGKKFFALGTLELSPNQEFMAYSVDFTGAEKFLIRFKNLKSQRILSDQIPDASYGMEWAADSRTIYYLKTDHAQRPCRLYRHFLGGGTKNDKLIYEEKDEAFHLGIDKTLDGKFILIVSASKTTTEVRLLNAKDPLAKPVLFARRKPGVEYFVDHIHPHFYVRTNERAKNFKIMRAEEGKFAKAFWKTFVPHRLNAVLADFSCFKNHLVLSKRQNGLGQIQVIELKKRRSHDIRFPEPTYDLDLGAQFEFDSRFLRLSYSSFTTPQTVFDYDFLKKKLIPIKVRKVLGGYSSKNYESQRIWARAKDGTRIPISLVYKKGLKKNSQNPVLLEGYGAYGASHDAYFSSSRLSLLNRGFVIAVAHIRGGGELGEAWHDGGKMMKKKNTFTDFIAAAEFLISTKWTNPQKLTISGGSAGGLLMGAVLNLRSDLFSKAILQVPFVDFLNTMSDPSLPLTIGEYEEWGNPSKRKDYFYMKSYSPYENLIAKNYPTILALASLNDSRVAYWEAAKWVAKLRSLKTDNHPLLLKINMDAGHGGSSGRYKELEELAFIYTFVLRL